MRQLGVVSEIDLRSSGENPQIVMNWLRTFIRPITDDGSCFSMIFSASSQAPFDKCDREEDYRVVWAELERRGL
ncbi:MAG: hypothetical protein GX640_12030 [Fibrobacter sp.]|nr:hypothetical protein [Fibrobacter sp.]